MLSSANLIKSATILPRLAKAMPSGRNGFLAMPTFIGISLGASDVHVGYLTQSGEPVAMRNAEGETATPMAVWLEGPGKVTTGKTAKCMQGVAADVFVEFLRDMDNYVVHETPCGSFTPSDLCGLLLRDVMSNIRQTSGETSDLTLTVSPSLSDAARSNITRAATLAMIGNFRVIDDNIAEAIYLRQRYGLKDGRYLTVKFGSGSSDATVFEVSGHDLRIRSSSGAQRLGQIDIMAKFEELICHKYLQSTGKRTSRTDLHTSRMLTHWSLEQAMESLAIREKVRISVNSEPGMLSLELTRQELADILKPIVLQVELMIDSAIDLAKLSAQHLDGTFLSASALSVHLLTEQMIKITRKSPSDCPEAAAALGAALYSAAKAEKEKLTCVQQGAIASTNVQLIAPSFLGIHEFDQEAWKLQNRVLIPKGEPIPTSRSIPLTANDSGLTPKIVVTESPIPMTDVDFVTNVLTLAPTRARPGSKHTLTVGFDQNGCIYARLKSDDRGDEHSGYLEPAPRKR